MPPDKAPIYTAIDVHSPRTLLPSAGKFIQSVTEEQQEAAIAIQRIQRGRAVRDHLANAIVHVEGVRMLLPPAPKSSSGLTEGDERALLGGATIKELTDEGHAKQLVSGKKNAVELANDLHEQQMKDEDMHEQMLEEAMRSQYMDETAKAEKESDIEADEAHAAYEKALQGEAAAMIAAGHQPSVTMGSLLEAVGSPEEQERMRAVWAKAAEDKASTDASLAAAEKEAKTENVWVYNPIDDTISEHAIFMDSMLGVPMGSPQFDDIMKNGGELYYNKADAEKAKDDALIASAQ